MVEKVNKNQVERTSQSGVKEQFPSQPKIAIVRNHLDTTYMGNLEVELTTATNAGQSTNAPGQIIVAKYLSPFHGVTSLEGTSENAGHANSQRSYGWWGVPPDIGAKVLVIFAEGGQAFWIGCIPEEHTNIMTPDPFVSSTYNDSDQSKKLPVVEYNKRTEDGTGRNSTQFVKPANQDAIEVLTTQGLIEDEIRGVTSTSSRREVPSAVTGFSSPGPQDRRPGAPRVNYGENFAQTPMPQNRLGGSSLVFDDGDATLIRKTPAKDGPPEYVNVEAGETGGDPTLPHNELVRLRTRTGHQILLHNTEDLIYIANARGTTWIELTANGKIDIYAQDSINVHSETDINFKADKNIRFEAGENIHMKAGTSIFGTAASNIELKAGADGKITAAKLDIDVPNTNMENVDITGNLIVSSNVNAGSLDAGSVNGTSAGSSWTDRPGSDDQILGSYSSASATAPSAATDAEPSERVPMHEPWAEHENLFNTTAVTPDTFRQNTSREAAAEPNTSPPETEEAPATTPTDGVISTPQVAANGVPENVNNALGGVQESVGQFSVGNLVNSVVESASQITHSVGQSIVGAIDSIASPGTLRNIANGITGSAIASTIGAVGSLLNLRTTLAKGQTPRPVNIPNTVDPYEGLDPKIDVATLKAVAAGEYPDGSTVTLTNGKTYTVNRVDDYYELT